MRDVVIVGAGPAGLSAALLLGRCRRDVLVCDHGSPRNAASQAMHGYLTRDGIAPRELLRIGREELRPYGIEVRDVAVRDVRRSDDRFDVTLETGERIDTRTVLLATGVRDELPAIDGLDACFGKSAFHCQYCDGWEVRDRMLAVVGRRSAGAVGLALALKTWSDRVVLCTGGRLRLSRAHRDQLRAHDVALHQRPIARVRHDDGHVQAVVLGDGSEVACDAIFFSTGQHMQSEIPRSLGCDVTSRGTIRTDLLGHTCVPGVFVVGDASRDVQFAIVAAAEGAKAGVAINKALQARAGLVAQAG